MLIMLSGGKGSPGATTLALAMAARWPARRRVLLVEADPGGGDLAPRCGLPEEPGLSTLVLAARRGTPVLAEHAQTAALGVDLVLAPARGAPALVAAVAANPALLRPDGCDVLVDTGRLGGDDPQRRLLAASDATILVVRGDLASLDHAAAGLSQATGSFGRLAAVAVVGPTRYHPTEIGELFGVGKLFAVPLDPRGAAVLVGARRAGRGWQRGALLAAAHTIAEPLADLAARTAALEVTR